MQGADQQSVLTATGCVLMEEMGQNQRGVPNDGACDSGGCKTVLYRRNDVKPKVPCSRTHQDRLQARVAPR